MNYTGSYRINDFEKFSIEDYQKALIDTSENLRKQGFDYGSAGARLGKICFELSELLFKYKKENNEKGLNVLKTVLDTFSYVTETKGCKDSKLFIDFDMPEKIQNTIHEIFNKELEYEKKTIANDLNELLATK